jgi:hypothetical protein
MNKTFLKYLSALRVILTSAAIPKKHSTGLICCLNGNGGVSTAKPIF